ncbi:MAG: hypothetical protein GF349_03325 [Candidatus Magasanikbacteria bacterium]|nr:hypothetical protein [Candidatus Magasanikbacteria bacterium]
MRIVLRALYLLTVSTLIVVFGIFVYANLLVSSFNVFIYDSIVEIENAPIAMVFGGGVDKNGAMTEMLAERVRRGVELYKVGKVKKIFMTGDDGSMRFDEITPMRNYAINLGVNAEDIMIDPASFNTYSSCLRAREEYNLTHVIAVSQSFHLPRILFFCNNQKIRTVGYPADLEELSFGDIIWGTNFREMLARLKGWWQMEYSQPNAVLVNSSKETEVVKK